MSKLLKGTLRFEELFWNNLLQFTAIYFIDIIKSYWSHYYKLEVANETFIFKTFLLANPINSGNRWNFSAHLANALKTEWKGNF